MANLLSWNVVRRVESMSPSAIAIFRTNCEKYRSQMLLEISIIILERFSLNIFTTTFTSCLLIPVSKYFLAKCLDERNFPRKYHLIIPVHLWIRIWSNDECALIVVYNFCALKRNTSRYQLQSHERSYWKLNRSCAIIASCCLSSKGAVMCDGVSRDGVGNNCQNAQFFRYVLIERPESQQKNTRNRFEICLKLTIMTPERHHWRRPGSFIINFWHILHLFLVLVLLTLNR